MARALGDVGAPAVMPLGKQVREVDLDERDRVRRGAGPRGGARRHAARRAVETLAEGRDTLVAAAAQRALARVAEVRAADEALRRSQQEGTVVRGFSRRFYDVLGGASGDTGAIELSRRRARGGRGRGAGRVSTVDGSADDDEIITHTNIPALAESTSPTPKSTLPRRPRLTVQSKIARS